MPFHPENALVWAEIPVTNLDRAEAFYKTVLQCDMRRDNSGHKPVSDIVATGVAGHLYQGQPATNGAGPTIHLAIDGRVEDALQRAIAAGAKAASPIVAIPPGRFVKVIDPDGNSIGLFEPA